MRKSYNRIIGANDLIRVATIGVNSRGKSMSGTFAGQKNAEVGIVCDVDERAIPKAIQAVMDAKQKATPKSEKDCRKVLEDKSIDAIYIATPDHWHAPLTIMGCQAGKHVYVEKPLSHNPARRRARDRGGAQIQARGANGCTAQVGTACSRRASSSCTRAL